MPMFKEKTVNILLFCSIITICTAVFQYLYPDLSFLDGGLIAAILLTVFLKSNTYTNLFSIIGVVLIIISGFYPHDSMDRQQIIMQHLFSAIIAVFTVIAVV